MTKKSLIVLLLALSLTACKKKEKPVETTIPVVTEEETTREYEKVVVVDTIRDKLNTVFSIQGVNIVLRSTTRGELEKVLGKPTSSKDGIDTYSKEYYEEIETESTVEISEEIEAESTAEAESTVEEAESTVEESESTTEAESTVAEAESTTEAESTAEIESTTDNVSVNMPEHIPGLTLYYTGDTKDDTVYAMEVFYSKKFPSEFRLDKIPPESIYADIKAEIQADLGIMLTENGNEAEYSDDECSIKLKNEDKGITIFVALNELWDKNYNVHD